MRDWGDVLGFALALPGTELATSWGKPAIKVRGKPFVYQGREAGSCAVACPIEDKELLMETDPATFWESEHVRGWPAVLVRFGGDGERAQAVIGRAWWDRAGRALRGGRARP